jgi:hypothetical protein
MECKDCLYFELARYYNDAADLPGGRHGYCNKGATPIERALLIREMAACRHDPPRFHKRSMA